MKKGLRILGVLAIASVLFYSCEQKTATPTAEVETSGEGMEAADMKVAFVYTDSVINKYDYFKKMSEEITAKGQRFDTDLQSRAKGFEQEVATFQQTGGNMTPNQARAKQDELVQKEQNLMTYRNNLMQELSADEAKMMNDIYEQVQSYIKEYAVENGIDIILSYTRGGAMWYANEAIDVTASVVEGLNKKYASNSGVTTPAAADSTAKK
ncbi:periplasmic chaperone for outer membrane proteins Skp [Algoriphagus boritolerans DSM 17298 = JCM 18970]|uniref:Periplasmic chaperone for outer membrane proteins Skp n=1 Tax=Algoriphagus boritolerans DSM 17298 = JCM 18970 TaxID=1120964 RepID=A0A1H5TMN0_9BACT|nr:periplasmic chaperone for outer membrane proteins Skp [Algoriphagus boritolerans DSM 17298 = JCM 18970]